MLKQYRPEMLTALTIAFMLWYPPRFGVIVLCATVASLLIYLSIEAYGRKKAPSLLKLEADVHDLKLKVEQMLLRGNR